MRSPKANYKKIHPLLLLGPDSLAMHTIRFASASLMRLISCSLKDPGAPTLFESAKSVGGGCRANPRAPAAVNEPSPNKTKGMKRKMGQLDLYIDLTGDITHDQYFWIEYRKVPDNERSISWTPPGYRRGLPVRSILGAGGRTGVAGPCESS